MSDDWLVKLMMMIIVIIIAHYPSSRVSLFIYNLLSSPNSVSYWCGHWRHLLTTNLEKDNSEFQGKSSRFSFHRISILLISHLRTQEFFLCLN